MVKKILLVFQGIGILYPLDQILLRFKIQR